MPPEGTPHLSLRNPRERRKAVRLHVSFSQPGPHNLNICGYSPLRSGSLVCDLGGDAGGGRRRRRGRGGGRVAAAEASEGRGGRGEERAAGPQ